MWLHIKLLSWLFHWRQPIVHAKFEKDECNIKTKKVSKEKMQNSRNFEILTFFMDLTFANQRKSSPPPILMHIQKPMSQDNDLS